MPSILIAALVTAAFIATCRMFDTGLADLTIDWLSFAAGIFLVLEAGYKRRMFPSDPALIHVLRAFRMVVGACIFMVHLAQFIWGINAPAFRMPVVTISIDWLAFFFGIFLMAEGLLRFAFSKERSFRDQALRAIRVALGTVVLTIHVLQFMRY